MYKTTDAHLWCRRGEAGVSFSHHSDVKKQSCGRCRKKDTTGICWIRMYIYESTKRQLEITGWEEGRWKTESKDDMWERVYKGRAGSSWQSTPGLYSTLTDHLLLRETTSDKTVLLLCSFPLLSSPSCCPVCVNFLQRKDIVWKALYF